MIAPSLDYCSKIWYSSLDAALPLLDLRRATVLSPNRKPRASALKVNPAGVLA